MRILFISDERIPSLSAEVIFVMKMCQALQEEGHDVTLLAPRIAGRAPPEQAALMRQYGLKLPIDIRFVPGWSRRRHHDRHVKYAWMARREGADFVWSRSTSAAAWSAWMGVPTIFDIHDRCFDWRQWPFLRLFLLSPGFRGVVTNTAALRSIMLTTLQGRLSEERIVAAPMGVDHERYASLSAPHIARQALQLEPGRFTVGYAGHLYPGRGVELIIDLAERLPEAHFLVLGGEPDAVEERRREVAHRNLANIQFKGFVSNADLPRYQAACDALLMPYQQRVEVHGGGGNTVDVMSPMKMFESLAAARLTISSDLPVLREVLHEGNAVLCDPQDVTAWQAAIERAMVDPAWKEAKQRQAQADARRYTWRARTRRVLDHFFPTASPRRPESRVIAGRVKRTDQPSVAA